MSQGELGVSVSMANPFDDNNSYYAEESNESTNNYNSYQNYQYSNNTENSYQNYQYSNNTEMESYSNQQTYYNDNSKNSGKTGFINKATNKFSDKVGKPFIRFSQKLNAKVTNFLHI